MVKFEHTNTGDHLNTVIIQSDESETLTQIVVNITKFLKAIGFNEIAIMEALSEEIEGIKDDIRENYIMSQDDEETESW